MRYVFLFFYINCGFSCGCVLHVQPTLQVKTILVAMATKILELATKFESKAPPAWRLKLRRRIERVSLIKQLKFFTGDQTWAVGGQMATKEKYKLGGLTAENKINFNWWLMQNFEKYTQNRIKIQNI